MSGIETTAGVRIEELDAADERAAPGHDIDCLAEILRAVVYDGAGVSFVVPFSLEDARRFWVEKVLPGVRAGTRRLLVARDLETSAEGGTGRREAETTGGERIVGTVQIDLATPPNQAHRAEVLKLLVDPAARRRGIARALMLAIEDVARSEGRTLLTLDTWTGSHAERLYRSLEYVTVGVIPRYARGSLTPELEPATLMYKELRRDQGFRVKD
jgi:ribosomal protein S18 acetylase RimI-like enzyme